MVNSRAKLPSDGNKRDFLFETLWVRNIYHLPAHALLQVSFKNILITPTTFIGMPNTASVVQ
jgi:hypothetical protein